MYLNISIVICILDFSGTGSCNIVCLVVLLLYYFLYVNICGKLNESMNVFFFINSKQAGSLTTNCEIYYKVTKWGMERYTVRTAALHIQVQ